MDQNKCNGVSKWPLSPKQQAGWGVGEADGSSGVWADREVLPPVLLVCVYVHLYRH